ncbi:phage integrase family protein [Humibacillus xanthopallidus]|uniref:Phage integrase family protein n=1 Tax=Humibacillus xanthopallidus TaxID=412689 RepID=A0A543PQZ5_9MICO|nr:tyrosine-type recombinase/integrase [Humibacillus xanthopallidus]TQN46495.1 phage integrase family protein [Humibacillus xanthopallidus]
MTSRTTLDVQVWGVRRYKGKRKTTYTVRWRVEGRILQRTFDTIKLAESFRARLLVGLRQAEPFDVQTGQPVSVLDKLPDVSWVDHAMTFVDVKWPHASPRHRKGIAEGLTTATVAALPASSIDPTVIRRALEGWVFNSAARSGSRETEPPEEHAAAVRWARRHSPSLVDMAASALLRRVLEALALKLDGKPASSSTVARKRSALYSAFQYAVEVAALPTNPLDRIAWRPPTHTDEIDRRVVVNPHQAKELLDVVAAIYPSLEAFFACIYYAGLRPSEVRHLKVQDFELPTSLDSWGTLHLLGSTQTVGSAWTDTGQATEDRSLKHRARRATRQVPAPPELVAVLRRHIDTFPPGLEGRLFVTRAGRAGIPVAPPFASPQSMGIVYRVWDKARQGALTEAEYRSPLAKRPYDLRHAAVSLWLNAGVPATQVAEWAGHSVSVLLRVYASCIVGQDAASRRRVELALSAAEGIRP